MNDELLQRLSLKQREEVTAKMCSSARALVETIGFEPALRFLKRYGGQRVFIPRTLPQSPDHWLMREFGPELAAALVRYFDGAHVEVPLLSSVERLLRDNAVRADFDDLCAEGNPDPVRTLVERYGLTQRYLRKVLKSSASTSPASRPADRLGGESPLPSMKGGRAAFQVAGGSPA